MTDKETLEDLKKAHKFSIYHKKQLINDNICGCFYCMRIFKPSEIKYWIKESPDETALCPYCGIDSVIGESSGYPITKEFLEKMQDYWFGSICLETKRFKDANQLD